jgi:nitroreductase
VDLDEARKHVPVATGGTRPEIIVSAPVVLVVTLDLTRVTAMDSGLGRLSISAGGSVYPFAHNVLLAARDAGFGGVVTSVLVRQEPQVKALLAIPDDYVVACTIPLGKPVREITKLRRKPVDDFATRDRFDGPVFVRP